MKCRRVCQQLFLGVKGGHETLFTVATMQTVFIFSSHTPNFSLEFEFGGYSLLTVYFHHSNCVLVKEAVTHFSISPSPLCILSETVIIPSRYLY